MIAPSIRAIGGAVKFRKGLRISRLPAAHILISAGWRGSRIGLDAATSAITAGLR